MNIFFLISLIMLVSWASKRLLDGKYPASDHGFMGRDYSTALKGVAIVIVMLGHCASLWMGGRMLTPLGGIGVALFLITSGYGLNESYKTHGLSDFWMKRLSKVYLPYLTVVLIWAVFSWESWNHFLFQALCVRSMYWFVPYIIGWYIMFWFCSRFLPRWRLPLFFAAGIASIFLLPEIEAEQALSFPAGVWLSRYVESGRSILLNNSKRLIITSLLILVGGGMLLMKQFPHIRTFEGTWLYSTIQLFIKFPLALAVVAGLGSVWRWAVSPFVLISGMISYELYLLHFPFYGHVGTRLWPAILLFVLSFAVGWLFNKLNVRSNRMLFGTR